MAETISDRSRVPETDFGLLGMEEVRTGELVRRVGEGFPYGVLENFRENVGLSAGEVADLVQINPRTLSRRKREGRLHADESDRVLRLSRVYGKALGLFGGDLGRPEERQQPINVACAVDPDLRLEVLPPRALPAI